MPIGRRRRRRPKTGCAGSCARGEYPACRPGVPLYWRMTHAPITPKSNGPVIIEGPVRIVTPDGRELTPPARKDGKPADVVLLCMCGGSATNAVCAGTY